MRAASFAWILLVAFSFPAAAQTPSASPKIIKLASTATGGSLSPTADRIAVLGNDKKLRVLNIADGNTLRTIDLQVTELDRLTLSPGGSWILAGDHLGNVAVWNTVAGKKQLQLHLAHYPGPAAFSRDGKLVAITPESQPVQIFDLASGHKISATAAVTGGVQAIAFSRDGSQLATADSSTAIRIYDTRTGKLIAQNNDFLLEPLAVEFTADGKQVIASGADKVIVFLDAASGKLIRKLPKLNQPVSWSSLSVSPDGKFFAAILMIAEDLTRPRAVAIWDVSTGEKQFEWTPPAVHTDIAWTSDNHLILVGVEEDSLKIWQIR